jgi:PhnB protein
MLIQPYLFFNGNCEQAFAFYREALGATIEHMMRYRDSPEAPPPGCVPPGAEDKIMHASLLIGDARLMASDDASGQSDGFKGFSVSVTAPDAQVAKRWFDALAVQGTVMMPLGPTFYSPCFGMLTDRFGLGWMVIVDPPAAP